MNENVNQPEQDSTQVGNPFPSISGPVSNQEPAPSADSLDEFAEYGYWMSFGITTQGTIVNATSLFCSGGTSR